jgi:predicted tellurium resistance membrane protein TerC
MFEVLLDPTNLVALLTLTILEIVLGVDNVIFIAIVTGGLPEDQREKAQKLGLSLALVGRIILVLGISWLLALNAPAFTLLGHEFTWTDLILLGGGLFLLYKATTEIFKTTELVEETHGAVLKATFAATVGQIVVIDVIFALDSVLTAVGLTKETLLIIIAMTIAILVMMFYATPLSRFIHAHPSLKVLALAFLVLVGVMLFLDGFGEHIERGYVYFAILFSLGVEALNFRRQTNLERKLAAAENAPV